MKKLLGRLFTVPPGERSLIKVIFWWELRRIAYNVILAVTGIVSLTVFALLVDGWFDFISPPAFPIIFFVFAANFFYTGGWLAETILRLLNREQVGNFGARAFKYGLMFAMFVAFVPTLVAAGFAVTGNRLKSPYSQFTTTKPVLRELQGIYHLNNAEGLIQLTPFPGVEFRPRLELLADGRACFNDFPLVVGDEYSFMSLDGELHVPYYPHDFANVLFLSGDAIWNIEQGNFTDECWSVEIQFVGFDLEENERTWKRIDKKFSIFLQGSSTPYRLYHIIGDPDSMRGMEFERKIK